MYLKVETKWRHLRWAVLTISGDSVAEEEILGMVNKGFSKFPCIFGQWCKLDKFCCIEVVNIFSALLCCRQLSSCLWRMRTVMSLLLSIIEGKLCSSAPTIHRLLHVPELVLITGPLVFTNSFFLEHSYSVTGKNLYASKNPALTCMLNMWTVTGG